MTSDSRLPYVWLIVHVAAIAAATTFLAVVIHEPVVDANIGAGFAMLALAALGMPWSLLVFSGVIPEGATSRKHRCSSRSHWPTC